MLNIKYKKLLIAALLSAAAINIDAADFTEKSLEMESVNAVNWIQTSAEYKMLAVQAFNAAEKNLMEMKQAAKKGQKLAVVVDLDETMIDNSPYAAWRINSGEGFDGSTWGEWVNEKDADAIPGAVEFSKFVAKNKMDIFYVSNRSDSSLKETMKNLKRLGFAQVNKNHIYLKTETSDKTSRREFLESLGYDITMLIGDQLTDFSNEIFERDNEYRNNFTDKNRYQFGYNWIVIPNPTYGDFEAKGVSNEFYNKMTGEETSTKEKSEMRQTRLNVWDGE